MPKWRKGQSGNPGSVAHWIVVHCFPQTANQIYMKGWRASESECEERMGIALDLEQEAYERMCAEDPDWMNDA